MADTQITILGMSGAGKTCYLLGLYYKMGSGIKGFTITSDDDTDVQLRDRYARMCDQSLGEERFPAGTDNISKYELELQYGYKKVMSFDWVDYPGGMLDRKNEGNLEEYESVKKAINNSAVLFVCVDGSLLVGGDKEEKIEKVQNSCSVINTFFSGYFKDNKTLPPTAIIVTKYDLCKDDTEEKELSEIIEEVFSSFFVKNDIKKIVTIIPVSIGLNIMDDDCSGKLKPKNIHLPIFMGIYFVLNEAIVKYGDELNRKKETTNNHVSDLKSKAKEENRRFFKKKEEIKKLAKEIRTAEAEGKKVTEEMNNILNTMKNNSENLEKELNTIPFVYIDGERRSSFAEVIG